MRVVDGAVIDIDVVDAPGVVLHAHFARARFTHDTSASCSTKVAGLLEENGFGHGRVLRMSSFSLAASRQVTEPHLDSRMTRRQSFRLGQVLKVSSLDIGVLTAADGPPGMGRTEKF